MRPVFGMPRSHFQSYQAIIFSAIFSPGWTFFLLACTNIKLVSKYVSTEELPENVKREVFVIVVCLYFFFPLLSELPFDWNETEMKNHS